MPYPVHSTCALCDENIRGGKPLADAVEIDCPVCGKYVLTQSALAELASGKYSSRLAFVWASRRGNDAGLPVRFTNYDLARIASDTSPAPSVLEAADEVLLAVAAAGPIYKQPVNVAATDWARYRLSGRGALKGIIQLLYDTKLIELQGSSDQWPMLTASGWSRAEELRRSTGEGRLVFVAMSFDASLTPAYDEGILPAIEKDCGFRAMRVDRAQYNDKIDDRIVADLRRSRFVVADFTLHRPGVYFEAGFGLGLGRSVIYTCRENDIEHAHFDTRQYNHIVWDTPASLREKLANRIRATIGAT
jgi:hypothetical protein